MRYSSPRETDKAFSLVEIVLAMGVFVTFMLPLVALLSFGVQDFGNSLSKTVESQITQQLYAEVQQSPYEDLASPGRVLDRIRYFDEEGHEVPADDPFVFSSSIIKADTPTVETPNSSLGVSAAATTMVTIVVARNLDLGQVELTPENLLTTRPDQISITPLAISDSGR